MKSVYAVLIGLASPVATAQAGAPDSARDFVAAIYKAYAQADAPSSLDADQERRIFSPGLLAGILRDQPGNGEVGKLDHDPICDCQDPDGLKVTAIDLSLSSDGLIIAHVRLMFGSALHQVTLKLIDTKSGWRVDDVGTRSTASLRRFLNLPSGGSE